MRPPSMIAGRIIAHRGGASLGPENTLAAVRALPALGIDWLEVDLQVLADDTPVVFHDRTLERCTDGTGELATLRWSDVAGLDAGSWFSPRHAGTRIPRLDELLALGLRTGLSLNLELKCYRPDRGPALAHATISALARAGFPPGRVLLSSFQPELLEACRGAGTGSPLGLICTRVPDDLPALAERLALATVHPDWQSLDEAGVGALRALGLEVYAWTANDPQAFEPYWRWGVNGVITDRPQDFLHVLAGREQSRGGS